MVSILFTFILCGACRVNFRLKSDTNLFEILKCKTTVSTIEVIYCFITFPSWCLVSLEQHHDSNIRFKGNVTWSWHLRNFCNLANSFKVVILKFKHIVSLSVDYVFKQHHDSNIRFKGNVTWSWHLRIFCNLTNSFKVVILKLFH